MSQKEEGYLSQGLDYLGFLNSELRGLQGFATLANELVQNAEDAEARWVTFDVCHDALVVENDALFSSCSQVELDDCPWEYDPTKGHRCDLHRFRRVAGGDKRRQGGTIGAFGIGFISVYQITDQPELMCGDRHWFIRPEQPEGQRIYWQATDRVPLTRFRLPWAKDPDSKLRRALQVQSVSSDITASIVDELLTALPRTIMFLNHVEKLKVLRNGNLVKTIKRTPQGVVLEIWDGEVRTAWHLIHGSFGEEARRLKRESGIEHDRQSDVTIALREGGEDLDGRLFAFLPTQQRTGLPFHFHADFFPSSDRKRILFDDDYQGRWNKSAIQAGAQSLASRLEDLTELMGHESFWNLVDQIKKRHSGSNSGNSESVFNSFWNSVKNKLSSSRIIFTSKGEWANTKEALLLTTYDEELEALPLLEELGLKIVHEDLKQHYLLLHSGDVGVKIISAIDLARALQGSENCKSVCSDRNHEILGREIKKLLAPLTGNRLQTARKELGTCSIALSSDRNLVQPQQLFRAEVSTLEVFKGLGLGAHFSHANNPEAIADLAPLITINKAVELLERLTNETLQELWTNDRRVISGLVHWLQERSALLDTELQKRVRALPIWPSGELLHSLDELVVPGTFVDELGLASIVDLKALSVESKFLLGIGAKELTIVTYARKQVKLAFDSNREIEPEARRQLVKLFAEKFSELGDDNQARKSLTACPIVECADGEFRLPGEVYFADESLEQLLGNDIPVATERAQSRKAVHNFLSWLGVASEPRVNDLLDRICSLITHRPDGPERKAMQGLFAYLAKRWERDLEKDETLKTLKELAWLPAEGDNSRWYKPGSLYSIFERRFFHTQAQFLDVRNQNEASKFLDYLGVKSTPTPAQMVSHLLAMAKANEPVTKDFYGRLNAYANDLNILRLKGEKCLLLNNERYVKPEQVFWEEHGFGSYRFRLSADMRAYADLLDQLGVKERPGTTDAIQVLKEICAQFGAQTSPLDPETKSVVLHCWCLLSDTTEQEFGELRDLKVIPDNRDILEPAHHIFFDDRPGLAQRFGNTLRSSVIPKPQDAWRGMQKGGVRTLSEAVTTRLVERENPAEDLWLHNHIVERRGMIARVVEAHRSAGDLDWDLGVLQDIRVDSVDHVLITHSLPFVTRTLNTPPVAVSAYYNPDDKILYFERSAAYPWAAIARELAYAINREAEAGKVAPGLKEVLTAGTMGEASASLDELGYASLDTVSTSGLTTIGTVELGGSEFENEPLALPTYHLPPLDNDPQPTGDHEDESAKPLSQGAVASIPIISGPPKPINTIGDSGPPAKPDSTQSQSSQSADSTKPRSEAGYIAGTGSGKRAGQRTKRSRLLSYVVPKGTVNEEPPDLEAAERRHEIDEAGIEKVTIYEREFRREAEVMSHHNEGFDLKSYDEDGKLVRYIEVKSLSGDWDVDNVKMTHSQFEHAVEIGERYWLYVVERAKSDNYTVHPIKNPGRQVMYFVYDPGWEALVGEEKDSQDNPSLR